MIFMEKIVFVFDALIPSEDRQSFLSVLRREEELNGADNKWELPGGKLEFGETPFEAAEREVYEETGYKVRAQKLLPVPHVNHWDYPNGVHTHTVIISCLCELIQELRMQMEDHKVRQIRWICIDKLDQFEFLPGVVDTVRNYFGVTNDEV